MVKNVYSGIVNIFFEKYKKKLLTFRKNTVEYPRTAYKPYQERWRERPDETRQPAYSVVPNPAANVKMRIR